MGKAAFGFGPNRIRTLVSIATDSSHMVIRGNMEGYLSKKFIHINESFVHAIALALW